MTDLERLHKMADLIPGGHPFAPDCPHGFRGIGADEDTPRSRCPACDGASRAASDFAAWWDSGDAEAAAARIRRQLDERTGRRRVDTTCKWGGTAYTARPRDQGVEIRGPAGF